MKSLSDIPGLGSVRPDRFLLIAGPCAVENEGVCMEIAGHLVQLSQELEIPYVFKASFTKANRSRLDSFTGIGHLEALTILSKVRDTFNIPVITDIHSVHDAVRCSDFVDLLQIPAFLCRQTELLVAAAQTGKWINIKKGQFMSPEAMQFAVDKVRSEGNEQVLLTERGNSFGYSDLVVDIRSLPIMKQFAPVILDCTHALQQPNQKGGVTGGQPEFIKPLALAGVAAGADGLFIETHPNPAEALSDGANMLDLAKIEGLLRTAIEVRQAIS